nr:uncharacterized protein LOC123002700 [Drosophila takahashii]
MQTSFVWIFLLISHVGAFRFLVEFCGTSITFKTTTSHRAEKYDAWLATIKNETHLQCHGTLIHKHFIYPICINLDKNFKRHVENSRTFEAFASSPGDYRLQAIRLRKLNRNNCQSSLAANPICAKSFSTSASCRLELGSPLTQYVRLPRAFPRHVQLGIRSNGSVGCNKAGAYTDLSSYVEWLERTVKRYEETPVVAPKEEKPKQMPSQGIWLYENCSGNTLSTKLRAFIYGLNFEGQGWLITDSTYLTQAIEIKYNY